MTPEQFTAEDIGFIASIAPTVFEEVTGSTPHDVPFFLLAGTADGDVTGGVDCDECDFYRIWQAAEGWKASAYVQGADHNDFNCCGFEDGVGPDLIGRDEAQGIAKSYLLALARIWLDEDPTLLDIFRRGYVGFAPSGIADHVVISTTYADDPLVGPLVIDDFQTEDDPTLASSGSVVSGTVLDIAEGDLEDDDNVMTWDEGDSMNGMTQATSYVDKAAGVSFRWDQGVDPSWTYELSSGVSNASTQRALTLTYAQLSRDPYTVQLSAPLAFTVTLIDADGVEAGVGFVDQAQAPVPYQRMGAGDGAGWADELVTVQIPLADFTLGSSLDLSRLATLRLEFGEGAAVGAIALDSVGFVP